jgi:hypothetical protein
MESIDDLLSQLKSEYEEKPQPQNLKKEPPFLDDRTIQELQKKPIHQPQSSWQNSVETFSDDSLIAEVKAEFEAQQQAEELQRQEQLKAEQVRQEQKKQQQRQLLTKQAEEWLKNLDLRSAEGLWFEEFAYTYASKLEAAIDYLQALQESTKQ